MKIQLHAVSASESGDYYQVLFEGELDGEEAYVFVQRPFELPDGGLCYVESRGNGSLYFRAVGSDDDDLRPRDEAR